MGSIEDRRHAKQTPSLAQLDVRASDEFPAYTLPERRHPSGYDAIAWIYTAPRFPDSDIPPVALHAGWNVLYTACGDGMPNILRNATRADHATVPWVLEPYALHDRRRGGLEP